MVFIVSISNAQTIEINGTVTDSKTKQTISGVNITIKSSNKGVTSDFDGKYSIKLNSNEIVIFSNIGYASQEFIITKSQTLNVALIEEANKLEEVVINVGYGTQKKKLITNAISSIKSEVFDNRPITNVGQAIQGNAAGVQVVQQSGKPGAGIDIKIRGASSVLSGNNPLYVIDGIQTYTTDGLNSNDIVDLQILKDATATAIYGVNGSSGVILITTKKGKSNKNNFIFNSYYGTSNIANNIEILSLEQYKGLMSELSTSYVQQISSNAYSGIYTDWRKEVFRTGEDKNYDLSFSGGTKKMRAFTSIGYQETDGIVKPANLSRLSGRLNLDLDATSWLKIHSNFNLNKNEFNNTADNKGADRGGVIMSTLMTPNYLPIYADQLNGRIFDPITGYKYDEKDGMFAINPFSTGSENPVAGQSKFEQTLSNRFMGNLGLDISILENLIWKPNITYDYTRSVYQYFVDSYRTKEGRGSESTLDKDKGIGREHTKKEQNINVENTINYIIRKGNHDINILVGGSVQKYRVDELKIEGTGFETSLRKLDLSQMMNLNRNSSDTIAREKNSVSSFGRITYNYKGKYIINGVFRASGSSQLAPDHKWGYFPGISAAWIISNEKFLENSKSISELKLRGGIGKTGNIGGIDYYSSYGLKYDDDGLLINYTNTDLTWETSIDRNIGIDLGLFNNRIKLTADGFYKTTTNLINKIKISTSNYFYNAGKMENKGVELALNTVNFKGDFNWSTNFNISFVKNKMLEMGKNPSEYYGYDGVIKLEKDRSLGNFYGYVVDSVNPDNGELVFKDINGDGSITTTDRTTIGNALPDYTFGFTNNLSYKGFSLDILFTGSQGNDIFNASRIFLEGMQDAQNQSTAVLDRWTTPGQITSVPKSGIDSSSSDIPVTANSTRWIEDGSYVRLKAATFGYEFKKLSFLDSLRFYVTGQNLLIWTKYKGFDPEVNSYSDNQKPEFGIDYGAYPQVRTFIFGIKAGF